MSVSCLARAGGSGGGQLLSFHVQCTYHYEWLNSMEKSDAGGTGMEGGQHLGGLGHFAKWAAGGLFERKAPRSGGDVAWGIANWQQARSDLISLVGVFYIARHAATRGLDVPSAGDFAR